MRITGVESSDLFTGDGGRALQVVRVTVEATEAGEAGAVAAVRVMGAGAQTPTPFLVTLGAPGEGRGGEVSIAVTGAPGVALPVTVIAEPVAAETAQGRAELAATITVAEPGWTMWMVSHFHYDPVWWNTQGQFTEARLVLPDEDGALPDIRTAFDLVRLHLEKARRDPDYTFVLAEVDYLKPYFDAFPQERGFLRSLLSGGRVELVGGTYNEPNTNLTGAETTIRNAVYGIGHQRGVLGAEVGSAWMLDVFGHDPGFPGLMAAAGLTSSSWARGPFHQWGPEDNAGMQFPAEFEWLSPDGSGLLTGYMANHYGAGWTLHTAADLNAALDAAHGQFRSLATVAATPNVMLPVGSDHVIPARWVTDVAREWSRRYVWPRFVCGLPRDFFAAVRAASQAEPKRYWIMPQTRDMNPLYTGKDVSYADTKLAQRAGEVAVLEGERLATLAWLRGAAYPAESLDKAWRQLAYGAHHDAITGTESDEVYLDLLAGWREAWERGEAVRQEAIGYLAVAGGAAAAADDASVAEPAYADGDGDGEPSVLVVNGLARDRDGMATLPLRLHAGSADWLEVLDPDSGAVLPALAEGAARHDDGSLAEVTLTFRATGVPALGFRRYPLRAVPVPDAALDPAAEPEPTDTRYPGYAESWPPRGTGSAGWTDIEAPGIANAAFAVTGSAQHGGAISVIDKRCDQPVLRSYGNDLVLQEEYAQHPRWGEGPWHLSPKGPGVSSRSAAATVTAQRSPVGSRLVASYRLGDLEVTAETILWDGAERVEFRTHVSGSIGKDHLLRVLFPASVAGGLPLYQTATAVIGRPFGVPEADTAEHWWTLDNPANQWFGVGSAARVSLTTPAGDVFVALGVAEVITPDIMMNDAGASIRELVTWLARAGVTATTSRATGPRYGSIAFDSNLPDFRIALGGPSENAFTAEVLAACDPSVAKRLTSLLADRGAARLWVPADKTRRQAFVPGADVRGPRDLPVIIVASADPGELDKALSELWRELMYGRITADVADIPASADAVSPASPSSAQLAPAWPAGVLPAGETSLAAGAVAVFNKGTPGCAVTTDGTLWMSLFRACSSWPSGVWIDGDQRTAPDGSSFAWQHWSHTFRYALASAGGANGWREAGFNAAAEDFNHDLIAVLAPAEAPGASPDQLAGLAELTESGEIEPEIASRIREMLDGFSGHGAGLSISGAPSVTLSALKPYGNPLASGRPGTPSERLVTVRLRETDGRLAIARVRLAGGIEAAWRGDLIEETLGARLTVESNTAYVPVQPFETVTVVLRPVAGDAGASVPSGVPDAAEAQPPEPAQPVYARYWLHGKGPAPAGNVPVSVHFNPARVTLREPASPDLTETADAPGDAGSQPADAINEARLSLSVACGPEPARGSVELVVPDGLSVRIDERAHTSPAERGGRGYELGPNEYASWPVVVSAGPQTPDGRYFIAARITDDLGQVLEDTALVTVGQPGAPEPDLDPMELFVRVPTDVQNLAAEADLHMLTSELRLSPGETGELAVKVANHLGSELRGELQLISPVGTWTLTEPWAAGVAVAPGGETEARFTVTVPATVAPGWHSWLLVKLMYFGRVRYSPAIALTVSAGEAAGSLTTGRPGLSAASPARSPGYGTADAEVPSRPFR
jgi:hypothetical protein